jgi:hypothetical protein
VTSPVQPRKFYCDPAKPLRITGTAAVSKPMPPHRWGLILTAGQFPLRIMALESACFANSFSESQSLRARRSFQPSDKPHRKPCNRCRTSSVGAQGIQDERHRCGTPKSCGVGCDPCAPAPEVFRTSMVTLNTNTAIHTNRSAVRGLKVPLWHSGPGDTFGCVEETLDISAGPGKAVGLDSAH